MLTCSPDTLEIPQQYIYQYNFLLFLLIYLNLLSSNLTYMFKCYCCWQMAGINFSCGRVISRRYSGENSLRCQVRVWQLWGGEFQEKETARFQERSFNWIIWGNPAFPYYSQCPRWNLPNYLLVHNFNTCTCLEKWYSSWFIKIFDGIDL